MKKSNYYYGMVSSIAMIIAGIFIDNKPGGILLGTGMELLIFVTIGRIAANKTLKKIDANTEAMRRQFEELKNPNN